MGSLLLVRYYMYRVYYIIQVVHIHVGTTIGETNYRYRCTYTIYRHTRRVQRYRVCIITGYTYIIKIII